MRYDINAIYYLVDEFCKIYLNWQKHKLIPSSNILDRAGKMSLSEMLTIMIIYHLSPTREFKFFYLYYLTPNHTNHIISKNSTKPSFNTTPNLIFNSSTNKT